MYLLNIWTVSKIKLTISEDLIETLINEDADLPRNISEDLSNSPIKFDVNFLKSNWKIYSKS